MVKKNNIFVTKSTNNYFCFSMVLSFLWWTRTVLLFRLITLHGQLRMSLTN